MEEEHFCDMCTAPMKLVKTVGAKKSCRPYRKRRYACTCCDYTKLIFADGFRDEIMEPKWAEKQIEAIFKKEEQARKA